MIRHSKLVVIRIDKDADANDATADSATGRISLGISEDLNIYHGGQDSYIVNKTGNMILNTQESSTGFILNAKMELLKLRRMVY